MPIKPNLHRAFGLGPFPQKFSFRCEDLNAAVFPVGDVDQTGGVDRDAVGQVELPGTGSRFAPGKQQLARRVEFVYATIAVTVGDVE
ncbi:MAG: hypothetical protein NT069_01135 [Planctomycetota bacterium]|nr:hypothetical protein [Planctomycetota bacterium]